MNKKVNSVLAITIIFFFASMIAVIIYFFSRNINQQILQSTIVEQKNTSNTIIKNNGIGKKYVSNWSLSFEYPAKDCDYVSGGHTTGECHDVILSLVDDGFSIGTLIKEKINGNINEYIRPNVLLYYEQDLIALKDEIGVEDYLRTTFNNKCLVDSWKIYKGTQIEEAVLSEGCRMWGGDPSVVKFFEENPGAKTLQGMQVGAYYNKETGEVIVYSFGNGAGCDFQECEASRKIQESIKFGEVKLSGLNKLIQN